MFWTGDFSKGLPEFSDSLRLFWSWSGDGQWQAPDNARFTFRGQPALYKLYVLRHLGTTTEPLETDPGVAFLNELLPALENALFSPSEP